MKRRGIIKTRGCDIFILQWVSANKNDCPSPTPAFYDFACICAMIGKEGRVIVTVDLPDIFYKLNIRIKR